ncbi:MAG: circadian clock protein KaiC [Gammaproteobacteria bacterium]|nr:circadian clock protein KaiC [Gammaproteobacteria bacterium]
MTPLRSADIAKVARPRIVQPLTKLTTGIEGFDLLSHGGLPRNRTTLLFGGPGAGKTVFALQCLVNAVHHHHASGIFVAFEERASEIIANSAGFDWGLDAIPEKQIYFLDARLSREVVKAGDFDLAGMLAMLTAKKEEIGAQWIVFDGIDVLLSRLQNPAAEVDEIYRIRDWLDDSGLTAIVTTKSEERPHESVQYGFMQFMADCVVRLGRRQEDRVASQLIQMIKYRGSGFAAAEFPLTFGSSGIEVAAGESTSVPGRASTQRLSLGFSDLDSLLGGGVYRGSSTLISGLPGTAKTTLAGRFLEAGCARGERTLFVSYDEGEGQIVRNLASVGIQLKQHVDSGLLHMFSARTDAISPEELFSGLKALIARHRPSCVVIDPLSALARSGSSITARSVASRFVHMVKDSGVTLLVTALSEADDPVAESTTLQISTIADTWIHLSYLVLSGERNRALTIVKSRGTAHSNQVRELVLSKSGLSLTDVYTGGGEVLMGTRRWEKEADLAESRSRMLAGAEIERRAMDHAMARTEAEIKLLQLELEQQRARMEVASSEALALEASSRSRETGLRTKRGNPAGKASTRVRSKSPR